MDRVIFFQKLAILKHSSHTNPITSIQGKNQNQACPRITSLWKSSQKEVAFALASNKQLNLMYRIFTNIVAMVEVSRAAEGWKSRGWSVALGNIWILVLYFLHVGLVVVVVCMPNGKTKCMSPLLDAPHKARYWGGCTQLLLLLPNVLLFDIGHQHRRRLDVTSLLPLLTFSSSHTIYKAVQSPSNAMSQLSFAPY